MRTIEAAEQMASQPLAGTIITSDGGGEPTIRKDGRWPIRWTSAS